MAASQWSPQTRAGWRGFTVDGDKTQVSDSAEFIKATFIFYSTLNASALCLVSCNETPGTEATFIVEILPPEATHGARQDPSMDPFVIKRTCIPALNRRTGFQPDFSSVEAGSFYAITPRVLETLLWVRIFCAAGLSKWEFGVERTGKGRIMKGRRRPAVPIRLASSVPSQRRREKLNNADIVGSEPGVTPLYPFPGSAAVAASSILY